MLNTHLQQDVMCDFLCCPRFGTRTHGFNWEAPSSAHLKRAANNWDCAFPPRSRTLCRTGPIHHPTLVRTTPCLGARGRDRETEQTLGSLGRAVLIRRGNPSRISKRAFLFQQLSRGDQLSLYWLAIYLGRRLGLPLCLFNGDKASQRQGQCPSLDSSRSRA